MLRDPNFRTAELGGLYRSHDLIDARSYFLPTKFALADDGTGAYIENVDEEEDDRSSISSHSTNSTVDDNPGPGRLVDKYLYQRLGRKLEKVAIRLGFVNPDPSQIVPFFTRLYTLRWFTPVYSASLSSSLRSITSRHGNSDHRHDRDSALIAGLKSLVKQSQSVLSHFVSVNDDI